LSEHWLVVVDQCERTQEKTQGAKAGCAESCHGWRHGFVDQGADQQKTGQRQTEPEEERRHSLSRSKVVPRRGRGDERLDIQDEKWVTRCRWPLLREPVSGEVILPARASENRASLGVVPAVLMTRGAAIQALDDRHGECPSTDGTGGIVSQSFEVCTLVENCHTRTSFYAPGARIRMQHNGGGRHGRLQSVTSRIPITIFVPW